MRAVVVDDSEFMRRSIKYILEKNGIFVVGEASNGLAGYLEYTTHKPDFITLDITMDICNGIECLKKIMEYDPKAKVIMLSAMGQDWMMAEAMENGAMCFLVKPFTEEKIKEITKHII